MRRTRAPKRRIAPAPSCQSFTGVRPARGMYDGHVFDGLTFADLAARGGPQVIINSTDMTVDASRPAGGEFLRESSEFLRFLREVGGGAARP